jgi:hypothetical protein
MYLMVLFLCNTYCDCWFFQDLLQFYCVTARFVADINNKLISIDIEFILFYSLIYNICNLWPYLWHLKSITGSNDDSDEYHDHK